MTPAERIRSRRWEATPVRSLLVLLVLLVVATPALAQRADFMFHRPRATVSVLGGWSIPGEGSDLFDFTREHLTVAEGDFASPSFAAELSIWATSRIDVTVGVDGASATVLSEMADFVTQDDAPIPQTTEFTRRRLLGGVKAYLLSRGRAISEFAWVPGGWSPFVGGGVGYTWYEFAQYGDFVDIDTWDIFGARFRSRGHGFTSYLTGGVDVTLSTHFLLRAEYRRFWGTAPLDPTVFDDFDDIDLSGSRVSLGIAARI